MKKLVLILALALSGFVACDGGDVQETSTDGFNAAERKEQLLGRWYCEEIDDRMVFQIEQKYVYTSAYVNQNKYPNITEVTSFTYNEYWYNGSDSDKHSYSGLHDVTADTIYFYGIIRASYDGPGMYVERYTDNWLFKYRLAEDGNSITVYYVEDDDGGENVNYVFVKEE